MSKRYLQFEIMVVVEDDQVDEVFDTLSDAAESALCHGEGPDHECDFEWTAGGYTESEEQMNERWRLEDILADLRRREQGKKEPQDDRPKRRRRVGDPS